MFKDIKIFQNDYLIEYDYKIDNELVFIINNIDNEQDGNLKIVYDENIYKININDNVKYENLNVGQILIYLDNNVTNFSFKVDVNYKFFIKTVYKFINKLIHIDILIQEINVFLKSNAGKKYQKELEKLLDKIENKDVSIEELILDGNDEVNRISNVLLNNQIYKSLVKQMDNQDLMLLITSYISVPMIPKIDQETFNDLVNSASKYDYPLENVWRLAMNFDNKGYNFDLIDEFFVNSKDSWYLSEYISSIDQIDQEKIINMIIATKDKNFIEELLDDNFFQEFVEEEYINKLKQLLKNKPIH